MTGKDYTEILKSKLDKNAGKYVFQKMAEGFNGQMPLLIGLSQAEEDGEDLTAGDIAQALNISTARVAKMLNILEESGLVERKSSKADGRITYVMLTDAGREEVSKHQNETLLFVDAMLKGIPDSDIMTFIEVLEKMTNNSLKLCKGVEKC